MEMQKSDLEHNQTRRPYIWAAPSFVIPGTVKENVHFLAGKVPEVALCLFEKEACLAYGQDDLPASLPMRCHVHLPCDLDWNQAKNPIEAGGLAALEATRVLSKVLPFSPSMCVLHPPKGALKDFLLEGFLHKWKQATALPVLLENVQGSPLTDLSKGLFGKGGFLVCLDVGHMLCYNQEELLAGNLPGLAQLLHWSAPQGRDRHLSLKFLEREEAETAVATIRATPASAIQLLEIFSWAGVESSLPVLDELWTKARGKERKGG